MKSKCPRCGTEVKENQKYCHECGYYLKAKKLDIKEIAIASFFIIIFLAVSLQFFLAHYKSENTGEPLNEEKEVEEKTKIQVKYIKAYENLVYAIDSGDINKSIKALEEFKKVIRDVEKEINRDHVEIIVPSSVIVSLERSIKRGDLKKAREDVKNIGSTCGVDLCHSQAGMLMFRFASMYYDIKRDIERGNLESAERKIPEFRKRFKEFKSAMMTVMPLETKIRMREEYIDNLERAIKDRNVTEAKNKIKEIGENMCAVKGCHSVLLTVEILSR